MSMEEALQNEVVLSTIFKLCPVPTLRTVRLVCNLWLQESLPTWRNKTIITFDGDRLVTSHRQNVNKDYYKKTIIIIMEGQEGDAAEMEQNNVTLDQFLDYVANPRLSGSWTAPFQNFCILMPVVDRPAPLDDNGSILSERFWELCGPHMKYVIVDGYRLKHCASLRTILLGPTTPKLETVVLACGDLAGADQVVNSTEPVYGPKPSMKSFKFRWSKGRVIDWDWQGQRAVDNARTLLPFTWQEMFTCFNNLKSLAISYELLNPRNRLETILAPLRTLDTFKSQGMLRKLRHLGFGKAISISNFPDPAGDDLYVPGTKAILEILGKMESLESFSLFFAPLRNVRLPALEYGRLLEKQKDHLVTLDLFKVRTPDGELFPPGINLPNLKTLVINAEQVGKKMEFLSSAPNLERVHILGYVNPGPSRDDKFSYCDINPEQDLKLFKKQCCTFGENMVEPLLGDPPINGNVKELICRKVYTLKELRQMTVQMPNLEVLVLPMENSALQLVCQKWTKLRRLTILEHPFEGVTDAGVIGCWDSPWPNNVSTASIRDLKDLRYLKWKWGDIFPGAPEEYVDYYRSRNDILMFVSLSCGIFQLPRLHHLEFIRITVKLSKSQKEELFRRVPSCVLSTMNYVTNRWKRVTNIWED